MHPFIVFAIILIVIWTLSGIASASNKQKEQERRRRMAQEMMRAAGTSGTPPALPPTIAPPRRIAQGLANRYPQVLRPPQPAPRRTAKQMARRPVPARTVAPPAAVRHIAQPFTPIRRPATLATVPPVPNVANPARAAQIERPAAPSSAPRSADAPAIARWLSPRTMQQQFILTEILQPPLALREQQAGDLR